MFSQDLPVDEVIRTRMIHQRVSHTHEWKTLQSDSPGIFLILTTDEQSSVHRTHPLVDLLGNQGSGP